jgi:surface protein
MMRKILFFCCLLQPPKVFAVQKWPLKLHSNSSVSLESGENNILFDSDVTTIYNKLTVYADVDFDFSTEFELAAKSLEELEVDVFDAETSQSSPPPPLPPPSPPPPPTCTKCIPAASWHAFVAECLAEAPVTGECTTWASGNNYGTMPNWDTSLVTDMSGIDGTSGQGFGKKSTFNGDISKWNTEKVTAMYFMFYQAYAFNHDIGSWNTAQVTDMGHMFYDAFAFNQDIGGWNTEKVATMGPMFFRASSFNQDIGDWNTALVTDMRHMFNSASAFNHDIGSWNTAQVTDMNTMFYSASAFNHDISSWTGSAATTAQMYMFYQATAFQAKYTCTNAVTGPVSSCVPR